MIQSTAHYPNERIVSALSAEFESASSPPDPALEFLDNVEAKIETEPGKEFPGGQGGQLTRVRDQLGLRSLPRMLPGRRGDSMPEIDHPARRMNSNLLTAIKQFLSSRISSTIHAIYWTMVNILDQRGSCL